MINFLRYRMLSLAFTVCAVGTFVGIYIYRETTRGYVFNYSVDFTGGSQVLLQFQNPVSSSAVKQVLDGAGWPGAVMRDFSDKEILVRVKEFSNDSLGLGEKIRATLASNMPENKVTILQIEAVGPGVGASLRAKSIKAVGLALLALLIYIAFVFSSIAFAVGAVVALFHDAFIMLLSFLLLDREISINMISAVLVVLGYSINDTIVIFAQIRHNLKKMAGTPLVEIVNVSINQTLRRTLLTSFSTLLTVTSMFILGGEALKDLSLTLLIGIIFGTYSSIYMASPIMMLLYKNKNNKK